MIFCSFFSVLSLSYLIRSSTLLVSNPIFLSFSPNSLICSSIFYSCSVFIALKSANWCSRSLILFSWEVIVSWWWWISFVRLLFVCSNCCILFLRDEIFSSSLLLYSKIYLKAVLCFSICCTAAERYTLSLAFSSFNPFIMFSSSLIFFCVVLFNCFIVSFNSFNYFP